MKPDTPSPLLTLASFGFVAAALLLLFAAAAHAESRFYPFAGAVVRQEATAGLRPNSFLGAQIGTAYSLGPIALQARTVFGPENGRAFGRFEVEFGARVKL